MLLVLVVPVPPKFSLTTMGQPTMTIMRTVVRTTTEIGAKLIGIWTTLICNICVQSLNNFPAGWAEMLVGMYLDNGTTCQIFSLECIEQYVTIARETLPTSLETFPHPLNRAPVSVVGLMPALFCSPAVVL
jgi:hypothetical protein